MLLLKQYYSLVEAEEEAKRLRKRGIMTFVSSKKSYSLSRLFTGSFTVGLWSVIENQHQDAYKLLNRKPCKVRHPLTDEEMIFLEEHASKIGPRVSGEFLANMALILAAVSIVFFIVLKLLINYV